MNLFKRSFPNKFQEITIQTDRKIKAKTYTFLLVAGQLQVARAKVQEEKPVFAIVEPAVVPLEPSGTSRKVYVLAFFSYQFVL